MRHISVTHIAFESMLAFEASALIVLTLYFLSLCPLLLVGLGVLLVVVHGPVLMRVLGLTLKRHGCKE